MTIAPDPEGLKALILEEWPQVPADAVARAGGDLDRLVELLAEHTDHTRALLRLQLAELVLVADRLAEMGAQPAKAGVGAKARPGPGTAGSPGPEPREGARPPPPGGDVDVLLGQVEAYLWELARAVPYDIATASARGARRHLGVSLSISAAIGFLVGLFIGGGVKRDADA